MKKYVISLISVLLGFLSLAVHAQSSNVSGLSIGLKAGTLGAGLDLNYPISDVLSVRAQFNNFSYDDTFEEDGIDYEGELELSSVGLLVDWKPFNGTFTLSAGVYNNGNKLTGSAINTGNEIFEIGDSFYQGIQSDPLTLNTNAELGSSTAGYMGLGWGNSHKSGFSFTLELGVLFAGSPSIALDVAGTAVNIESGQTFNVNDASNPLTIELNQEIDQEIKNLEEDISEFDIYPVLAIGIAYRF